MSRHKGGSEFERTTSGVRVPPTRTDLAAFRKHHRSAVAFTDGLRERRCRRTGHFDEGLPVTMSVFEPLFARWNMEVLFLLYMRGPQRFNAVKAGLGGVSSRVLTDKLGHLVDLGLVQRKADQGGRRVTYALTPRGDVVARHLHPLVFFLHNEDDLGRTTTS